MIAYEKKPTIKEWLARENVPIGKLASHLHRDRGYICGVINGTQALGVDIFRELPAAIRFECSFVEMKYSNELAHLIMRARMTQIQYVLKNINNNHISEQDLCKINAIIDGYFDGELEI